MNAKIAFIAFTLSVLMLAQIVTAAVSEMQENMLAREAGEASSAAAQSNPIEVSTEETAGPCRRRRRRLSTLRALGNCHGRKDGEPHQQPPVMLRQPEPLDMNEAASNQRIKKAAKYIKGAPEVHGTKPEADVQQLLDEYSQDPKFKELDTLSDRYYKYEPWMEAGDFLEELQKTVNALPAPGKSIDKRIVFCKPVFLSTQICKIFHSSWSILVHAHAHISITHARAHTHRQLSDSQRRTSS